MVGPPQRRSRRASREHSLWRTYRYTRVRVEDEPKKAKKPKKPKEAKETKETQNHTTQWPIVFVPEGQWRGRGGPPDRGRRGQRVLRGQRVSRGISRLRRQRHSLETPAMVFWGCLLVLAWGETTNRTMADGREWYSCRTIRCGSGSWQDCGAGLWNRRQAHGVLAVQRQYSFRRQPEVTQRGKGVTTQTCFLPRGRRAQARSVGEGASPCQANLGVFHGRLLRHEAYGRRVRALQGEGRGFPLTLCLFIKTTPYDG